MGLLKTFSYGGYKSSDFGLYLLGSNTYNLGTRNITTTQIPGLDGSVVQDNGMYDDVVVTYTVAIKHIPAIGLPNNPSSDMLMYNKIKAIRRLLLQDGTTKYRELRDDYFPLMYREGYFVGPAEWETNLNLYGQCDLNFVCKPRIYLDEVPGDGKHRGSELKDWTSGGDPIVVNPWGKDIQFFYDKSLYGALVYQGYKYNPMPIFEGAELRLQLYHSDTGKPFTLTEPGEITLSCEQTGKGKIWDLTIEIPVGTYGSNGNFCIDIDGDKKEITMYDATWTTDEPVETEGTKRNVTGLLTELTDWPHLKSIPIDAGKNRNYKYEITTKFSDNLYTSSKHPYFDTTFYKARFYLV